MKKIIKKNFAILMSLLISTGNFCCAMHQTIAKVNGLEIIDFSMREMPEDDDSSLDTPPDEFMVSIIKSLNTSPKIQLPFSFVEKRKKSRQLAVENRSLRNTFFLAFLLTYGIKVEIKISKPQKSFSSAPNSFQITKINGNEVKFRKNRLFSDQLLSDKDLCKKLGLQTTMILNGQQINWLSFPVRVKGKGYFYYPDFKKSIFFKQDLSVNTLAFNKLITSEENFSLKRNHTKSLTCADLTFDEKDVITRYNLKDYFKEMIGTSGIMPNKNFLDSILDYADQYTDFRQD